MALNTRKQFTLDDRVWVKLPPKPSLLGVPAHQAKEGALLMLEAGAQPYPALLRLAGVASHFTMDHALDLSANDLARKERAAAEAERQRRIASGRLKVIEPKPKDDPAAQADAQRRADERDRQRERVALSRFPVKRKDGLSAALLLVLLEHDGRAQFTARFFASAGFDEVSVANMATLARRSPRPGN